MQLSQLTFFRFLAAAIVVIFHHGYGSGLASLAPAVLTAGPEMVSFFFVLSGFIMVIAYAERPRIRKRTYWLARFARIAPVYFLALFLSWYLSFGGELESDWRSGLLGITFLQAWIPPYARSLNIPGWSLSVEAFFYLLFPFLLLACQRRSTRKIATFTLLFWLLSQGVLLILVNSRFYSPYPSIAHDLIYFLPLTNLNSFLAGSAGGIFYTRYLRQRQFPPLFTFALVLLAGALISQALAHEANLYNLKTLFSLHKIPEGPGILAPLYLFLILALAIDRSWLQKILSCSPFVFLGEISYSIYILQHPANLFFKRYLTRYGLEELGLSNDQLFYIYFVALSLLCAFTYTQFETPLRRFLTALPRRPDARRVTPAVPAFPLPALDPNYPEPDPRD